jgi:hypothetical protein
MLSFVHVLVHSYHLIYEVSRPLQSPVHLIACPMDQLTHKDEDVKVTNLESNP